MDDHGDALRARLEAARDRLWSVLQGVDESILAGQHSPILGPILWDLGHIAAFEELWLIEAVEGRRPEGCSGLPELFDAEVHARAVRGQLEVPDLASLHARLQQVRERTVARICPADDPLLRDGFVWNMVAAHEHWHIETILASLNLHGGVVREVEVQPAGASGWVEVPGGTWTVGTDDRAFAYDNERPAHPVTLAPYRIGRGLVTNADYARFVEDGGYADESLWSPAGWAWRRDESVERPAFWEDDGERCFGCVRPRVGSAPVQHVSQYEAEAYARWAGARLPTEAEWEVAARAGLLDQAFGVLWQWTASTFEPWPGFQPFPYPQYSAPFFGDSAYRALRGGSHMSDPILCRPTLRSWDHPYRRSTIFCGFRLADG